MKNVYSLLLCSAFCTTLLGCSKTYNAEPLTIADKVNTPLFQKNDSVIPFTKSLQRKWGSAVIADLDQNGWEDVITTQHGLNTLVYWNDNGTFTEPDVLIKGDTHGLAVADYNGDGQMNVVISQGGGDGGSPRRPAYFSIGKDRTITRLGTFEHFRPSRGRTIKFLDANQDAQLDLFATGFAPKNVKNLTTNQMYLNDKGEFGQPETLTIAHDALSVKALTTDIENDGATDIFTFGGSDMTLSKGDGEGHFNSFGQQALGELTKLRFVNNLTEIDYDNDGDFDLFVGRSKYQFQQETYYDPVEKNMAFFVFRKQFLFDSIEVEGQNLVLENIQETYATYDIQLGKNRTVVQADRLEKYTEGRLSIKPEDALGWPEGEELKGLHIGYLGNGKWRIGGYVKSRLSAVVKNVISQPEELKRKSIPARLLENQNGTFVDVTEQMGIEIPEQTTSAAAGDFNNDGFVDLAISPYGNMALPVEHFVLINDAGKGFVKHKNAGLLSDEIGATGVGVTTFDYDHDGRLDLVFGNERGRWYFAENQLNDANIGNFVALSISKSPQQNAQPTGARVELSACGTKQAQLVGASGDGFHQMLNTRLHFGLGTCSDVDSVTVTWSNGERKTVTDIKANTSVKI